MADAPQPITPLTALVINAEGQLTYMGQDGRRYVIVGDAELLRQLNAFEDHQQDDQDA